MAKRKLSESQRKSLRDDIRGKMEAGVSRSDLVRSLAAKYKISPISMRWYLRTQPAGAPGAPILANKPGGAAASSVLSLLNGLTQSKMKRLLEAKKLIPKLQVFRRHEDELRDRIRQLEKRLESEAGKARGVEARIKRLAGL